MPNSQSNSGTHNGIFNGEELPPSFFESELWNPLPQFSSMDPLRIAIPEEYREAVSVAYNTSAVPPPRGSADNHRQTMGNAQNGAAAPAIARPGVHFSPRLTPDETTVFRELDAGSPRMYDVIAER